MVNNIGLETMCPKNFNKINGVRYLKSIENSHSNKFKCLQV